MGNYKTRLAGIYIIVNTATNKYYIGKSVCIFERWQSHYSLLKQNKHHSPELQLEFNEYGIVNFEFKVLEYISKTDFKTLYKVKGKVLDKLFNTYLLQRERDCMKKYSVNQCLNSDKKYFT